ncbi:MAG: hypothetical protein MMC23_005558 [Stictis urceolatum]|nr:hypothetical protein [Stictis urceolata]
MDPLASSLSHLDIQDDIESSAAYSFMPFRLFDLPAELRRKILDLVFGREDTLDIDLRVHKLLSLFAVSKQFHAEASQSFYSSNTFRLLPTHGRAAWKHAVPLIKCFPSSCRALITSLEFRLGPFWTNPPKCWYINDSVGLEDCENVLVLKVFIEIDPSHAIFNGFRSARLSYTDFAEDLLESTIQRLPNVNEVQIDGYPSVTPDLPLMAKMAQVAVEFGMRVTWGPGQHEARNRTKRGKRDSQNQGMVPFYSRSPDSAIIEDSPIVTGSSATSHQRPPAFVGLAFPSPSCNTTLGSRA